MSFEKYLLDARHEARAERFLERIIRRLIDISFHVIREQTQTTPRDYHDSFLRLALLGVVNGEQAARFARLPGLRNRLAHERNGRDEQLVYAAVQQVTSELPAFLVAVRRHLS